MTAPDLREWAPGDGLTCTYVKRSPIPCGRPVKTAVSVEAKGPRGGTRTIRRPLCEHHARGRETGNAPGVVHAEAKRRAYERLAYEHWERFTQYVAEAIEEIQS